MSEAKNGVRIVSKTSGFSSPFEETPVLGDKPFHLATEKKSLDGWVYMGEEQSPGNPAPVNIGLGMIMGYPDPTQFIEAHTHDVDEVVFLLSMRQDDKLGCEVEFDIDGETYTFTDTTVVFVPKDVVHCPLRYKNFDGKPPYNYIMHVLLAPVYG